MGLSLSCVHDSSNSTQSIEDQDTRSTGSPRLEQDNGSHGKNSDLSNGNSSEKKGKEAILELSGKTSAIHKNKQALDHTKPQNVVETTDKSASIDQNTRIENETQKIHSLNPTGTPVFPSQEILFFPLDENPETLQILLLEKNTLHPETHQNCLSQISALTESAKNSEALEKVTDSVLLIIKESVERFHWCFLAMHHQLNRNLNGSTLTVGHSKNPCLI